MPGKARVKPISARVSSAETVKTMRWMVAGVSAVPLMTVVVVVLPVS